MCALGAAGVHGGEDGQLPRVQRHTLTGMLLQDVLRQVYQHQRARLARFRGDPATWWAERSIDALRASAPVPRDTVQVRTEKEISL